MSEPRHHIEHPGSLGQENKKVLDTMSDAYAAIINLAEQGFTVLNTEVSQNVPRVHIRHIGKCKTLKGTWRISRRTSAGRSRIMCAEVKGVQVEWEEFLNS